MAHITTNTAAVSGSNPLVGVAKAVFDFFVSIGDMNARVRETERLNAMSDAELSKLGLRREDIARHVFRDVFYI